MGAMGSLARNLAVLLSLLAFHPLESVAGPLAAFRFTGDNFLVTPARLERRDVDIGNCRTWSQSNAWDTCQGFLDKYRLNMTEFYRMNPSVDPDCYYFVPGATYCRRTIAVIPVTTDGSCGLDAGTNVTCINSGFGDCCGSNGHCGSTDEYCAIGNCQEGDCPGLGYTTDGLCGKNHGFLECGGQWGKCCSNPGRCGNTDAECGVGNCQSGACIESSTTTSSTTSTSSVPTPSPYSPSPDGTCGYKNKYKCTDTEYYFGSCCGAAGYCGFTDWECSNLRGCQSEFGLCDTTVLVTLGATATAPLSATSTTSTIVTATPTP
ncbi:hypothetical protein GQ53DRAFT_761702 [Thozetella sp. PMI_491]|nr:hypothetical protein GQ53DRAFT_761702 [Thozetella sp. PMI_491]